METGNIYFFIEIKTGPLGPFIVRTFRFGVPSDRELVLRVPPHHHCYFGRSNLSSDSDSGAAGTYSPPEEAEE